ncbi:hypothetical protein DEJ24_12215 [Curtobacterium sp. MCPF17_001]|uniref:hypothetical protein n=1 Tax=Curtobacterium sp. MCPF17_001 TaxID=2175651 RepID=UPI000DA73DE3|nr:hypothetical protein [Curtobacterium sp. MCPF17_001]PZE57325.1 hypothetical protein DEJ24_12215 [Curtobacterium sp. MCPF17_001]
MHDTTRDRLTALAAVVAALVPAIAVVASWLQVALTWPDQYSIGFRTVMAVGLAAAAVVTIEALRNHDHVLLAFALAALTYSVAGLVPGAAWPLGTVLFIAARVLLFVFGVLLVLRTRPSTTGDTTTDTTADTTAGAASGPLHRVAAWAVLVGAGIWLAWTVVEPVLFGFWMPPQDALTVLFAIPQTAQFVAFVGALLVFAPPLLRPVGHGARRLWETADVR